jgi:predicted enzyme related to lactoylglutathione lyase
MTIDMKAAEAFYKDVVGWTSAPFEGSPQPYTMFNRSGATPAAGVMPRPQGMNAPPFWAMYVGVPNLEGAAFYIYEPASTAQQPEGAPEVGEASWLELMTTDASRAMKFYNEVFGWRPSEALDMGPMGKYQMFNRPHGMIGGMMNKPPEMAHVPPHWQIYFRVSDLTAAIERIKANGGQVLNGPMDVPGGDWIVNAVDPQGAAFSLHARKIQ